MESGIYKIVNITNNKFYIGSSKNLKKRWCQHKSDLNRNAHHSLILQRAWSKYGENSFEFNIIEICEESKLFEKEQKYIDTLKPKYNVGLQACGGDNLTNNPNREEIIKRIVIGLYFRNQNMTDGEKEKRSNNLKGDKNPNFGNKWTEEMRKSMSDRVIEHFKTHDHYKTGKKHKEIFGEEKAKEISDKISNFASTRVGEKNAFYGKHHSEETKKIAHDRMIGKYFGEQNIRFSINGKEYDSLGIASKELDIPITTIRWRIKSNNVKFTEYKYI